MAERKKAPDYGPDGVDRWSSNGYGLMLNGKPVEPVNDDDREDDIEEVEED